MFQQRRWNMGSRGREAVVTVAPSRDRDGCRNQKTREGIPESQQRHRPEDLWKVWRGPVLGPKRVTSIPAIGDVGKSHGGVE